MDQFVESLTHADTWIALASLTLLEIVLGIDNIVFIAILAGRLPKSRQATAYRLGLIGALVTRIGLLLTISWMMKLEDPLFSIKIPYLMDVPEEISGRDLILLIGGLFLIGKSAHEIYDKVEKHGDESAVKGWGSSMAATVIQIMLLDIVFSLDSVITAVGMVSQVRIMVVAIIIAIGIMLLFAQPIGDFVNRHPSMKILALSFLLLIGVLLTGESLGQHISKGYIYFAMAFGLLIELLNIRADKKRLAARSAPENPGWEPPSK